MAKNSRLEVDRDAFRRPLLKFYCQFYVHLDPLKITVMRVSKVLVNFRKIRRPQCLSVKHRPVPRQHQHELSDLERARLMKINSDDQKQEIMDFSVH